mmetsp:Transcript_27081/g.45133  ORF Transcript_27081/g.45133 Transcript_27081/m.45133 type:complete len:99 (-) Transcript_27081:1237-1533(-)
MLRGSSEPWLPTPKGTPGTPSKSLPAATTKLPAVMAGGPITRSHLKCTALWDKKTLCGSKVTAAETGLHDLAIDASMPTQRALILSPVTQRMTRQGCH